MSRRRLRNGLLLLLPVLLLSIAVVMPVAAVAPEEGPFARTWTRTEQPIRAGVASRTWMWGPGALDEGLFEPYAEAHNNGRFVQYFDKGRMEISHLPDADSDSIWYVTSGLLAKELITGDMQVGDTLFEDRTPADINVAGDPDDVNGPTYATFSLLLQAPAHADGADIVTRVNPAGITWVDEVLAKHDVTAAQRVQVPGIDHQVASPFWAFMTSQGTIYEDGDYVQGNLFVDPFYATGYPLTEAYWAEVQVGGQPQDVLTQCFERRCLTYTPANPDAWQVEAGNVGLHYHHWRYAQAPAMAPALGDVIYDWHVGDWAEADEPEVSSVSHVGNEVRLSLLTGFSELYSFIDPAAMPADIEGLSISADVRTLTPETVGFGCLATRYYEDDVSYAVYLYCIDDLGALTFWYESYNFESGDFSSELLMSFRGSPAAHAVGEWNSLSAVMLDGTIWLTVNGDLVGTVEDERIKEGTVALYGLNFDESEAANPLSYAFRNLTMQALD